MPVTPPSAAPEHAATHDPDAELPEEPLDFLDPPFRPDAIGRLGHYEVLQVVGRGGFGIVFRAFDDVLQRVVAIKVLSPRMAATSPARQRFVREARGYAGVRHENVVQVHAIEAEPLPYLVMEFIPGETLESLLNRTGPLPAADVVRVGVQVARGLAAAHAINLVHRDVKPANILIENGPDRRVKLTDFGLARAADDASLTQSGVVAGTPLFMAPEQAHGDALDHRADLFSLGSVLYTMATGRPPFRAPTSMAVLKRVCDDDPRPIRELIPEVPPGLCDVIARLHAKDPAARVQTAAELVELLTQSLTASAEVSRAPVASPKPPARRARRLVPVAAAALIGVAVAAVCFALPGKQPAAGGDHLPPPSPPAPALADRLAAADWAWGEPENLGPGVNSGARELAPALAGDEKEVVFIRDLALWTARRASPDEPFAAAEPLFEPETGIGFQNPTLTGDGLVLAFAALPATREWGEVRVAARRSRAEAFGPPVRLAAPVNPPPGVAKGTVAPVFSADGLSLVVSTNLPPAGSADGPSGYDLVLFTRPTRDAAFGAGQLFPAPVSSRVYDAPCWLSDDGRVLVRTRMEKQPFETRLHLRASRAEPFGPPLPFDIPGVSGEVGRAWLSADGERAYFHSREGAAVAGSVDLWVTRRVPKP